MNRGNVSFPLFPFYPQLLYGVQKDMIIFIDQATFLRTIRQLLRGNIPCVDNGQSFVVTMIRHADQATAEYYGRIPAHSGTSRRDERHRPYHFGYQRRNTAPAEKSGGKRICPFRKSTVHSVEKIKAPAVLCRQARGSFMSVLWCQAKAFIHFLFCVGSCRM